MSTSAENKEARKRSVEHLQRLLTVVVSLAVAQALQRLVFVDTVPNSPDYPDWVMFISFFVTLVPFFHGANRYLDAAYITLESPARPIGLVCDFFFLLIESMIFYLMAAFIGALPTFYWILFTLLILDAIWVGITFLYKQDKSPANKKQAKFSYLPWLGLNVVAALLLVWVANTTTLPSTARLVLLGLLSIIRTALDYWLSLPVYFPVPAPNPKEES